MSFLFESPVKTDKDLPETKYFPIFDPRWKATPKEVNKKPKSKSEDVAIIKSGASSGAMKSRRQQRRVKPYSARKNLFDSSKQYILDLGQKGLERLECKDCNMLYTRGEQNDEHLHDQYHDKFVNGLKFNNWKHIEVVNNYEDGYVVRIRPTSPTNLLKKMDELFELADLELGMHSNEETYRSPSSVILIFVIQKHIGGFVWAERIKAANRILSEEPLVASTADETAKVGITRIWTHPKYRRQGIATRLLDTLLAHFDSAGPPLSRHQIAFSDPTMVGRNFAKSFFKTNNFLIYMQRHLANFEQD